MKASDAAVSCRMCCRTSSSTAEGDVVRLAAGRLLKDPGLERPVHHGGKRRQLAREGTEPLEALGDNAPDTVRDRHVVGLAGAPALLERPHRRHHHERIALAEPPDALLERRDGGGTTRQGPQEIERLGATERR